MSNRLLDISRQYDNTLSALKKVRPKKDRLMDFTWSRTKRIVRLDPFGHALHRVLNQVTTYRLLPEGSWTEGGCWCLGQALKLWLGDKVALEALFFAETGKRPQHVVARVGDSYLDGDGVMWVEELRFKCCMIDAYPEFTLRPVDDSDFKDSGIEKMEENARQLAERLQHYFERPDRASLPPHVRPASRRRC